MQRKHLPIPRAIAHLLVITAGWSLFFAGWWWVLTTPAAHTGLATFLLVTSACLAGFPLATWWWIHHNTRQKRQRRTKLRISVIQRAGQRDWNGLAMIMNATEAKHSPWLSVRTLGHVKTIQARSSLRYDQHEEAA